MSYVCVITAVLTVDNDRSHGLFSGSDQMVPLVVVIAPSSVIARAEGHGGSLASKAEG